MNIDAMRKIDAWIGGPMCCILTFVRMIVAKFRPLQLGQVKKILFVKPAEQGATVLAYPAIIKAIEKVGRENVYFIIFEKNRPILDVMDVVPYDNIITVPTQNIFSVITGFFRAILRIRREKIDTAIDFEFFARISAIICYLSGAKRRIGLHSFAGEAPYRGNLMTHPILYNCHIHTIDVFRILVESIDASVKKLPGLHILRKSGQNDKLPKFCPAKEDVNELKQVLYRKIGSNSIPPLIIVNANASDLLPLRCWPTHNYIELARQVLEKYPEARVIFSGAIKEADAAKRIVTEINSNRCIALAGETTFRQLMTLYTIAKVLVTNDSGPAHFASLTSIYIIVLFGPETPILFAPKSNRTYVVDAGLVCSPCMSAFNGRRTKCQDNVCMQAITVEHVFDKTCQAYELSMEKKTRKSEDVGISKVGETERLELVSNSNQEILFHENKIS